MFSEINKVLDGLLSVYAEANAVPVSWENFNYQPIAGQTYLLAYNLPSDTSGIGLAGNSANEHLGVYQIDINAPINKGKKEALDMLDSLAGVYSRGVHTYQGSTIKVRDIKRSKSRTEDDRFVISLSIYYQSFT
jgi:hypothetical protein